MDSADPPTDASSPAPTLLSMVGHNRDIYQLAELFEQRRHPPERLRPNLVCARCGDPTLSFEADHVTCTACGAAFPIENDVLDLRPDDLTDPGSSDWARLNEQFLNYHRSLTVHTLLNSAPINNYVGLQSGLRDARDLRVLDVGGGTGHVFCSFFRYPESIDYVLLDPNLRLLHDQFVRVYPELLDLRMTHLLGVAEVLPFVEGTFDLVMSLSAIDHFRDYPTFMAEAFKVLKPGGRVLISSHLDTGAPQPPSGSRWAKLFSISAFEVIGRRLFFRKHRVGSDDHTYHFDTSAPIADALRVTGFEIEVSEDFRGHFFVLARKPEDS